MKRRLMDACSCSPFLTRSGKPHKNKDSPVPLPMKKYRVVYETRALKQQFVEAESEAEARFMVESALTESSEESWDVQAAEQV